MTRIERIILAAAGLAIVLSSAESSYRDGWLGEMVATGGEADSVLSGYGCEGASGVLYAHEESDFPICERIEAPAVR